MTTRSSRRVSLDELFDRADRIWTYADEIYSATKYPFVSRQVLRTAPTFGDLSRHIWEAGRMEAEVERRRLEAEKARLRAEIRALGGEPRFFDTPDPLAASTPPPVEVPPESQAPAVLGPDDFPWINDWAESIDARAFIDAMFYAVNDFLVPDPPPYWPEVIRRPVIYFTRLRLVWHADLVIHGQMRAPNGESDEAYVARFTRRVLRLDADCWESVGMAIAEGRWRKADNPIAYVSEVAQREHWRAEGWLNPSRSSDVYAYEVPLSLDRTTTVTGELLGALIPERVDPFADADFMSDLELAVRRSALSPGAQLALFARLAGISRRQAAQLFDMTAAEAEAAWKALQRASPELRRHLSA